jgi:hypothetical protein
MLRFGSVDPDTEFEIYDDFLHLHDWWAAVNDGGTGTNTLDATHGGTYSVVTAAADNDYHFITSDAKWLTPAANKGFVFKARVKLTEANTDDANIIVGVSSDVASTALGADGAGPPASYTGCLFFKVDNGTVWQAETSNAGTQTTTASAAAFTSGAWTLLEIRFDPFDDTTARVVFMVNGTRVAEHKLAVASLAACAPIFGVKAGGANAETLIVDYVALRCKK